MTDEKIRVLPPPLDEVINTERDIFGRDKFASSILSLFEKSADFLVVALDEPWGTGKTVFARRFANQAKHHGLNPVYFDAFKYDYESDVFVAFVTAILESIDSSSKESKLKTAAKETAKLLGRITLKAGLRLGSAGVIDLAEANAAAEKIGRVIGQVAESELEALIDQRMADFAKADATFSKFRQALVDFAKEKPIVIVVDELDRCRPDYGLELLETVKHFFSVEGVHFLICANFRTISQAATARYGYRSDEKDYVEKFVSFYCRFPRHSYDTETRMIKIFIQSYLDRIEKGNFNFPSFEDYISEICVKMRYSLRDVERLLITCYLTGFYANYSRTGFIATLTLIDLKINSPKLFAKAKLGELEFSDIENRYRKNLMVDPSNGYYYYDNHVFLEIIKFFECEFRHRDERTEYYYVGILGDRLNKGVGNIDVRRLANDVVDRIMV